MDKLDEVNINAVARKQNKQAEAEVVPSSSLSKVRVSLVELS